MTISLNSICTIELEIIEGVRPNLIILEALSMAFKDFSGLPRTLRTDVDEKSAFESMTSPTFVQNLGRIGRQEVGHFSEMISEGTKNLPNA